MFLAMYNIEIRLNNYNDINYIVRYNRKNKDLHNFWKTGHDSIVERKLCPGMLMLC